MIKDLVKDTAILSQRCEKATADDAALAEDLVDTLKSLEDAACLAANQIGVAKSVVVWMDDDGNAHVMYNPRLMMGLQASKAVETCLTLEEPVKVTRYNKVKVSFDELVDGTLVQRKRDYVGWEAQMIQHMIDHCNGKLV
ncbi:MAG: peptide deformylase [Coriobacteriales bacterium]|jgi:peptide deformylase|nr:peptide deformylase [Coriobacteriales bacterium]